MMERQDGNTMSANISEAGETDKVPITSEKRIKLSIFAPNFFNLGFDHELLLNRDDFSDVQAGDVVEIHHPDVEDKEERTRVLLKVEDASLYPDNGMTKPVNKDTIYVGKAVADAFNLLNFQDVVVRKVDPKTALLCSVELIFKEQYLGRSEMWRLRKNLVGSCVYLNKKVEYLGGTIRCAVNELWRNGERVACGLISPETKVVFRSSSAMVYLFIQMSAEMWEYDNHGDLYFEKAVDGFLKEMFFKWKKVDSAHEVTVVLFTRCFYDAKSREEFPPRMLECLQTGYNGSFYEDFYHVIVQNERFEDWMPTIFTLKHKFCTYRDYVLNYHRCDGDDPKDSVAVPRATISTAAQGNFLEVLNMSLNTFEYHYLNRNLDRTGQQSIVITPGVGIFEVDRELSVITKQRIIDSGVGSDLICVGEQPLHAAPLFKFHSSKEDNKQDSPVEYSMPHWINLSYYDDPDKKLGYSKFKSRTKLCNKIDEIVNCVEFTKKKNCRLGCCRVISPLLRPLIHRIDDDVLHPGGHAMFEPELVHDWPSPLHPYEFEDENERREFEDKDPEADFDEYDDNIFKPCQTPKPFTNQLSFTNARSNLAVPPQKLSDQPKSSRSRTQRRKFSDPEVEAPKERRSRQLAGISIPNQGFRGRGEGGRDSSGSYEGGSADHAVPAAATSLNIGHIQLHHCDAASVMSGDNEKTADAAEGEFSDKNLQIDETFDHEAIKQYLLRPGRALVNPFDPSLTTVRMSSNRRRWTHIFPVGPSSVGGAKNDSKSSRISGPSSSSSSDILKRIAYGNVGSAQPKGRRDSDRVANVFRVRNAEQENNPWSPTAPCSSGVDWKSLAIPASLPTTTDYVPEEKVLIHEYLVNEYDIVPSDIMAEATHQRSPMQKPKLTNEEVFLELISQRLAQGFQLITKDNNNVSANNDNQLRKKSLSVSSLPSQSPLKLAMSPRSVPVRRSLVGKVEPSAVVWLSIGRIYHKLTLSDDKSNILVTKYRPRQEASKNMSIHYRYRFQAPDNDSYEVSWVEFRTEKLENFNWSHMDFYVCTRGDKEYLLTENLKYWRYRLHVLPLTAYLPHTRRILDGSSDVCDIYQAPEPEHEVELVDGFIRFVETCINRLRRTVPVRQTLLPPHKSRSCQPEATRRGFRERAVTSMSGMERSKVFGRGPSRRARHESSGARNSLGSSDVANGSSVACIDHFGSNAGSAGSFDLCGSASAVVDNGNDFRSGEETQQEQSLNVATSTLNEMLDAMKKPQGGLQFFANSPGLPPFTFVAYEAVAWLKNNVEGVESYAKAIDIIRGMLEKRLVCHASGDTNQPFVNGFHLYAVSQDFSAFVDEVPYKGDSETFKNDWVEIRLRTENAAKVVAAEMADPPEFLWDDMSEFAARERTRKNHKVNERFYKSATFDVESTGGRRCDRKEWWHLKYQQQYEYDSAFELALQWSVASGGLVGDMLTSWARKAIQSGLSIIPVPHDPFALPITLNSDPVRGPIFIELDSDCLRDERQNLFEGFEPSTWEQRMFLFREEIARKFGFVVTYITDRQQSSDLFSTDHQYIHCTGNMFLLIPRQLQLQTGIQGIKLRPHIAGIGLTVSRERSGRGAITPVYESLDKEELEGAAEEKRYTRHISETKPAYDHSETGFLWSWNFTISKRWKQVSSTGATGDIKFMDKMLADFRAFCANNDNRLKNFWDQCWVRKIKRDFP